MNQVFHEAISFLLCISVFFFSYYISLFPPQY